MITILTGPVGGGKTTFLKAAVGLLRGRGLLLDGYLCERIMDDGQIIGYDLADLCSGGRRPFLRMPGPPGGQKTGRYVLDPDGLAAAETIIGRSRPGALLIIDELGPLELEGKGVWPAAAPVFADSRRSCLAVVRETLLAGFRAHWPEGIETAVVELPVSRDPEVLAEAVSEVRA